MAPKSKRSAAASSEQGPIPPPPPLLPVPEDAALPGDKLCAACAGLELTARRFIVFPGDAEYQQWTARHTMPVVLQSVSDAQRNTGCPLCRLLLIALAGGADSVPLFDRKGRAMQVAISWGATGRAPNRDQSWARLSDVHMLYPNLLADDGKFPDLDLSTMAMFPEITLLANDAPADTPAEAMPFLPRPVARSGIDFDLVRRWFDICLVRHRSVCSSARTLREMDWESPALAVPRFRCIDLDDNCLVLLRDVVAASEGGVAAGPPRYAALSYVWGRAASVDDFFQTLVGNVAERSVPGFFARDENRGRVPRTIRDAMTVTRRLGVRYLWVDSLCILQDDCGDDWLEAIRKMDNVYGAAYVVLCAAGSRDAFAGIDGVEAGRGPAGDVRHVEQIADGLRLAFLSANQPGLKSPYYTRGWTYQEDHFACRTLVFSNGTATLRCRSELSFAESRFEDTSMIKKAPAPSFAGTNNDVGEIEGRIQGYSERQLTSETDIYRAFAGVGRQLQRHLKCDLCHGLPSRFFDWFLLWQPLGDERDNKPILKRRPVAPSWSWAGWHGAVWSRIWDWLTRDMIVVRRAIRRRTWIIWHQRVGHGSTDFVPVRRHGNTNDDDGQECNFYGGPPRKHERFPGIDCSVTDPTPRVLVATESLPMYTVDIISEHPGSGFLQFWTIAAVFELRLVGTGDDGVYGELSRLKQRKSKSSPASSIGDEWTDVNGSDDEDSESEDMPPVDRVPREENDDSDSSSDDDSDRLLDDDFDPDREPGIKLIIGGKNGRAIGRIYVPTWWQGLKKLDTMTNAPHLYEFIVICEARDKRAENMSRVDEDGGWRYRVMLTELKCEQYNERVAIGSVGLEDLGKSFSPLVWKEFVLG